MRGLLAIAVSLLAALFPVRAFATFHVNIIVEVFSSPDGTVQYIEFLCTANTQHLMSGHQMTSNANTYDFLTNLPSSTTLNKHFLVATQAFANLPGAVTPDYIMPEQFFSVNGDTLTLVDAILPEFTFTNGQLPLDGVNSLSRNPNTLVFSTAANSPQNFAGQIGSVEVPVLDPDNVYVDLDAAQSGEGTVGSPFNTLAAAVAAANDAATLHIAPSTSAETFAGAQSIAKPLILVNANPAGGPVRIGATGARAEELAHPKTGFISRGLRSLSDP